MNDVHEHGVHGWLAAAPVVTVLVATTLAGGYLVLVRRRERTLGRRWSGLRTGAWLAGAVLVAAGLSPWTVEAAHADARGHMAQHLLLGMYAPLGVVLAAPMTLLLGASAPGTRRLLARLLHSLPVRLLTRPAVAAVLAVAGLYVLYLPGRTTAAQDHPAPHLLVSLHLLLAGTLFTWSVAGPDPAGPHPASLRHRVVVLVLAAGAHAFLATLLYARAPALPPGNGHPAAELEQAALWMYYGGDIAEVALAVALFAGWYRSTARRA